MAKDRLSGKLAVILHADVAGSTALVQQDKELAHERIQDTFQRFSDTIEKYQGHVIELRGDALLAEFERASDAVLAAISFQSDHAYHILRLKDDLRPSVRVGISIGEVIVADNTVTGPGVVQAQRVEQLADPGGVCVTAAIHESLPKRMPFDLEDLGEQVLKGFDIPVRVYRVELSANQSIRSPQQDDKNEATQNKSRLIVAIIVIALVVAGGVAYLFTPQDPKVEAASIERMAFPLPDKPSIAVLPFSNLSDDKQQEYFADGMTEDLITDISKVAGLFVIARNSVFTYKGKAVKVWQVAEELGVRYVMEGSVRRIGNQVRINAQLIDATTGGHLWAERYDGSLDDVFAMQDKITQSIVTALAVTLTGKSESEAPDKTSSTEAYDAYLQGWKHYRKETPDDFTKAIKYFEQALQRDPDYAQARTALAAVYWNATWRRWIRPSGISYSEVTDQARRYLRDALRRPSALTHQVASEMAAFSQRSANKALTEAERAIALDKNAPAGHLARANALIKSKRPAEAIDAMHQAMRLDPHFPAFYLTRLGRAQFDLGLYEDAVATLQKSTARNPEDDRAFMYMAAAYGQLNRIKEAESAITSTDALRVNAGWDGLTISDISYFKWIGNREQLKEGLKKAGAALGGEWLSLVTRIGNSFEIEGATKIDLETAKALYDRGVVFVGTHQALIRERIPGSHFLNWWRGNYGQRQQEFTEARLLKLIDKTDEFVVYSSEVVPDAAYATAYAVTHGFQKVYFFEDGMYAWKTAGYPIGLGK